MSQENVEIARRAVEAASRRPKPDFAIVNALFHADHELVSLITMRGNAVRGAGGLREWLTDVEDAYEAWNIKVDEASALDEQRVLLVITSRAKGRSSGAPVAHQIGVVMTLRAGKVARSETYPSRAEALEAVGRLTQ